MNRRTVVVVWVCMDCTSVRGVAGGRVVGSMGRTVVGGGIVAV